ncbi:hypothetical protein HRW23_11245 [Streptomyces lunaelactis]|uniref:DUF5709 domain-containing protein n=1 Tax=Streptomyces lunaelactis TaxID=1535768 RepID=UPI0015849EF4|nr:DUF5709 domain-containing protein [Streptomyces lunaelactis]NUK00955.1 hypothetical protein [Streptomyces lunaelactis]NUK13247.1 hypothetical protein [Streptomyces lunaelactis]NUK13753.1 hypothetical protein [Streptomyces lunaelactis]NUK21606.1 hypothetical protein [Streptomyces lunaelactis]NUK32395.1 hypothetical protein [Streptomyces lunaelactis]
MSESSMGDEVYQPDGSEVQDDAGLLDAEDTLEDPALQILSDGYSPPERPWAVEHVGTTAAEQRRGESLDERLAEEAPDITVPAGDGLGDVWDTDGELIDDEVGAERAGRLVAPDEGAHSDLEKELLATDVGIDGAASAEEAAMHLIPESEQP